MNIFYAPNKAENIEGVSIFLAGSIEMNVAENWQERVINAFNEILKSAKLKNSETINIFNPRRKEWDSSWKQTIDDDNFRTQVEWELEHLDKADIIYLYFDKNTKSPISLLELGLYAEKGKLIVCCPNEFYRKGNVDIVCKKFDIPLFDDFEESLDYLIFKAVKNKKVEPISDFDKRFNKFDSIANKLKEQNIELVAIDGGNPVLEDKSCNFRLTQNLTAWDVYSIDEVVNMIVSSRDKHLNKK